MSGCDGWSSGKAPTPEFNHIPLKGRTVFVIPDRDFATNRGVYDGMKYLAEHLLSEYLAAGVKFVSLPGRNNTDGADDMLARHPADRRGDILLRLLEAAGGKTGDLPKRPPSRRRRDSHFFDDRGTLLPATFWQYLDENHRLALCGDWSVAYYADGVYHNGESRRFSKAVTDALGDDFVPAHERTVLEIARNQLKVGNRVVPDFVDRPFINVLNGLVDLRNGMLYGHDPGFLVTTQLPVKWDPAATCPTWEWLVNSALPGQLERLEDIISQMLDWTRCPTRILILYGASRAGKGLILRVIEWLMGRGNYSAVTLHQLADNRFMAAELFGKRANIAGELKPEEVRDISIIKMLTGGDPIQADKKFGATFTFYSRAFLAFSCNRLPPINETTKAFGARVAPFHSRWATSGGRTSRWKTACALNYRASWCGSSRHGRRDRCVVVRSCPLMPPPRHTSATTSTMWRGSCAPAPARLNGSPMGRSGKNCSRHGSSGVIPTMKT
jgi:putative DNA primase/helicase